MSIAAIDVGQLFELVWAAAAAGIVVAVAFALTIVGFTRSADLRRDGAGGTATAYGVMGFLGGAIFLATMVFGVLVIVSK